MASCTLIAHYSVILHTLSAYECQAVVETDLPARSSKRAFQQLSLKSRPEPVAATPIENLVEMWTLQLHLQTYGIRICITTNSPRVKRMLKYEEPWNNERCWGRKRRAGRGSWSPWLWSPSATAGSKVGEGQARGPPFSPDTARLHCWHQYWIRQGSALRKGKTLSNSILNMMKVPSSLVFDKSSSRQHGLSGHATGSHSFRPATVPCVPKADFWPRRALGLQPQRLPSSKRDVRKKDISPCFQRCILKVFTPSQLHPTL